MCRSATGKGNYDIKYLQSGDHAGDQIDLDCRCQSWNGNVPETMQNPCIVSGTLPFQDRLQVTKIDDHRPSKPLPDLCEDDHVQCQPAVTEEVYRSKAKGSQDLVHETVITCREQVLPEITYDQCA